MGFQRASNCACRRLPSRSGERPRCGEVKVFPFIATLATMSIMSGLALQLSAGVPNIRRARQLFEPSLRPPLRNCHAGGDRVAVLVVAALILRYTRVGRHLYAVGGNEEAARLSGIAIDRVKLFAYVLSGLCAAVGSLILTARVASGQPSLGTTCRSRRSRQSCSAACRSSEDAGR